MKLRLGHVLFLGLALVGAAPIAACSSSDSGQNNSPGAKSFPGVGEHQSVAITAATGGTVKGTGVSLDIPAGALSADTTITLDIKDPSGYAGADAIAVNVFDFGPNGTTFTTPVPLTIDLQGQAVPAGKVANLAFYDTTKSAWTVLDGSTVANGKVTANTTHFTAFTIVWSAGAGQTGGGCASLDFTPCGGDLTGTWTFSAACLDLPPGQGDPTGGKCPQATAAVTIDMSGTITFAAGGTYDVTGTTSASMSFSVPASCMTSLGISSCSQLNPDATDDGSGGCKMTQAEDPSSNTESGTYTTSNNQLTTTETGETPDDPMEYCVTGNTLKAKGTDTDGNMHIYVATKQ